MSGQTLERSTFSKFFKMLTGRDLSAPPGSIVVPAEATCDIIAKGWSTGSTPSASPKPDFVKSITELRVFSCKAAAYLDILERELDRWHNTHYETWWRGLSDNEVRREIQLMRRR